MRFGEVRMRDSSKREDTKALCLGVWLLAFHVRAFGVMTSESRSRAAIAEYRLVRAINGHLMADDAGRIVMTAHGGRWVSSIAASTFIDDRGKPVAAYVKRVE
jgi:hypothetical protein